MKLEINLNTLLLIVAVVLLVLIFRGCGKSPSGNLEAVQAMDDHIETVQQERDFFRAERDSLRAELRAAQEQLDSREKTTIIRYEKIPDIIRNTRNTDSLRAISERYRLR